MPSDDPKQPNEPSRIDLALDSVNAGYVAELYEQYRRDPGSVEREWRTLFESGRAGFAPAPPSDGREENGRGAAAAPREPGPPADKPANAQAPQPPPGATPIKGPAARLVQNMTASLAVPTATSFRDIDVGVLEARRRELNGQLAPRKISFTHLIGWAIVRAASEQPSMASYYTDADGSPHRVDPESISLGLAVDVQRRDGGRFLVVPVIRDADGLDFAEFHARYEDLVARARSNKLSPDDFVGATLTLTNPGTLGTTASVPRLMPGQGTIVATGAIRDVGPRRVMTVTSTYDHRVIQGAESGAFLRRIDSLLAGDDGFYEEVFTTLGANAGVAAGADPPTVTDATA
ncbi:MAG TPA: 2-oxo acid dehydrogenase subunit E2, partial [Candidatus Limnocylindrales bacterium]|nr:2-oxo acid dehydrogenase subunit E2 [Candidatus Limnocylindrales bacterium]